MKNAPATDQSNESAKSDTGQADYTTGHPSWLRVQGILEGMPFRHLYSAVEPRGALLKCLMVHLIKAPDNRACRASTIKTISRGAGFVPADVRRLIDWLIRAGIVQQIASADGGITLQLAEVASHAD